jgi:hypothetical protein
MMTLHVPEEIKTSVWNFVSNNNIGQRSKANGNKVQQYVGLLGEVVVKKYLGVDYELKSGFDGGFDLNYKGLKIDVKTMGRTVEPRENYVNNFIAYQEKFDCDAYVFCSLNKTNYNLTVCGWVTKKQLQERSKIYKEGTERTRADGSVFKLKAPTYEIKNNQLNNIEDL